MTTLFRSLLGIPAAVLLAGLASAQTFHMNLAVESSYVSGCWPPCLCPLSFTDDFQGSFDMTFTGTDTSGNLVYEVTNVQWTIPASPSAVQVISGSGTYRVFPGGLSSQRLDLDLMFDGGPSTPFTSGDVLANTTFPDVSLSINANGMVCFDRVFNIVAEAEPGTSYCNALPNSSGFPALMGSSGSASLTLNELVLEAAPLPVSQPGLFFYGPNEIEIPFGNGLRCVGGTVFRLFPIGNSGPTGQLTHALDVTNPPGGPGGGGHILSSSTWKFQAWFRDPDAMGSGFNLSNGLSVTFLL